MILASAQSVINRQGLSERVGTVDSMESSLLPVTSQLENTIGTSFSREDRIDYFGCVKNVGNASSPLYILNLTNSILDKDEKVKLYVTSDGLPITGVTGASANVTRVDDIDFEINHKTGRIHAYLNSDLFSKAFVRRSIAVRYTSGFELEEDGEEPFRLAKQSQVPDSIKAAAITLSIRTARASTAPKPKINTLESRHELSKNARSLVANYIRTRMLGDNPQGTELK